MTLACRRLALVVLSAWPLGCEKLPAAPETPDQPPAAAFFFTPVAPIYAGQTPVQFNAMGSRDPDGRVASYVWNFGDGTADVTMTDPAIRHTFPDNGARCITVTYGVSLVVVDDQGERGVTSQNVTVTQPPPPTAPECR
jgi:PKD repeat protein